ncbi:MAG: hypothetical protein ACXABY_33975, partial [Candidatus Thorarchaeota archaeon]
THPIRERRIRPSMIATKNPSVWYFIGCLLLGGVCVRHDLLYCIQHAKAMRFVSAYESYTSQIWTTLYGYKDLSNMTDCGVLLNQRGLVVD